MLKWNFRIMYFYYKIKSQSFVGLVQCKKYYLVSWRRTVIRWMQAIWDNDVSKSCLTWSIRLDTFSNFYDKIKSEISLQ